MPQLCKFVDSGGKRCHKNASFGYEEKRDRIMCKKHKSEEMVSKSKKPNTCPCGTIPIFGYTGEKPTCCVKCKKGDMTDIKSKKCACGTKMCYGLPGESPSCCAKCKTDDMIVVSSKKLCACNKQPTFALEGMKPVCCKDCKSPDMVNTFNKRCNSNSPPHNIPCPMGGNRNYEGFCTHCFANLFPNNPKTAQIRKKSKELAVVSFISTEFKDFLHDKPLFTQDCDCSHRRRIDLRKLVNGTLVCIEVDEHQHKHYDKQDQENRYNDLFMMYTGKMIFIRYNPDKYKDEDGKSRNPSVKTRYDRLKEEVEKQIKRVEAEENADLLEIIHLYYDHSVPDIKTNIELELVFED